MPVRAGWGWMCAGLLAVAGMAEARSVANVKMEDVEAVGGRQLALRHMALKEKLFFDVYVWGLYLEDVAGRLPPPPPLVAVVGTGGAGLLAPPEEPAEDVLEPQDTAKRLRFHLKRSLSRGQLEQGIREALGGCDRLHAPEMRDSLERVIEVLHDVRRGDELIITYVPGEGTYVTGRVRHTALIPGRAFADALFHTWMERNRL